MCEGLNFVQSNEMIIPWSLLTTLKAFSIFEATGAVTKKIAKPGEIKPSFMLNLSNFLIHPVG
jgi:hypothetical protein